MSNEACIPLVLALDDASATLEQVGGKGASLARMAAAGLSVPPGFHITTAAYRCFVAENRLQEEILTAVSVASADDPATLEDASRQIGQLFAQGVMPGAIAVAVRQAYAELNGGNQPVAVRSSATAEDLPEMSFAGQQETYLNMHGEAMVLDAVKRCWASLWTARAIGYRARYNIAPQDVSLAVVVQELVPADAAGILFTANPLTGVRDQAMINAAWGLGEAIVAGQVTPDTVIVDKTSRKIIQQDISEKDVMTIRTPEGTHEEPVPADRRKQAVLTPEQAAELAHIGVQIEDLYGQPMDIEWALHDGRFFVVQARPITALPDVSEPAAESQEAQAAEWQLPNPKGLYTRNSVIELLPDPLSPLFATMALPRWNEAMKTLLSHNDTGGWSSRVLGNLMSDYVLITINGYAYYDISAIKTQNVKTLLMMPAIVSPFVRLLRTARQRWEQEGHPAYAKIVSRWENEDLRAVSATQLLDGVREIVDQTAQYYLTIQSGILPAAYMSEALFTLFYNKLVRRRADPPAQAFVLGYMSAPIQAEQSLYDLAQWARTQEQLAEALSQMSSAQFTAAYQATQIPRVDEATWSEFRKRFAAHLERFGHTIYDLDFAKSVPADDPASLLETLKFFLSGKAQDPRRRQEATAAKREQAMQTILGRLKGGPRLALFRRLVKWAQDLAPLREDALADAGLGWPIVRRMLQEIGRRLLQAHAIGTQDDVFWLTLDELQAAVHALDNEQSPAAYQAVIAERRAAWKRQSKLTPPVALPAKGGIRFWGRDWSDVMPARAEQQAGDVIKGIGASAGRVTGTARVIHGPDEFDQMRPGDILVARITTPAWTPLFALATGVITDVGGPLSHSSIVAREYHIPAVLGTGVATKRLSSGQRVTVDGDAGTVTVSSLESVLS
ncbi:MAG TPA: PEP/pyruvate-binding domain-containing protein [Ktedonobacteraceae bacterium]|nr:PEP/pyruvate-binding domain-containing protein [Ktedonobacteraceae bacterium]